MTASLPIAPRPEPSGLTRALRRGEGWLRRRYVEPDRPLVAVEVRRRSVGVVRAVGQGRGRVLGAAASLDLPAGTLDLSMTQPNVRDATAFRLALRGVLEKAGVLSGGPVCLVLPDPVARIALVPGSEVKGKKRSDTDELVRFRLRKAVPFDIREAQVDYVRLGDSAEAMVLAVAVYRPVLEGYEAACASLGLHAGIVELAGLVLLAAAFPGGAAADRLFVNWDDGYVSMVVIQGERLALVRTLAGESATPDQVARELSNTDIYYRERLGGMGWSDVVLRSAALPPAEAASVVSRALEREPRVLDAWGGWRASRARPRPPRP